MAVSKDSSFPTSSDFPLYRDKDTLRKWRDSEKVGSSFLGRLVSGAAEIAISLTDGDSFNYNGVTWPSPAPTTIGAAAKLLTRVRFYKISNLNGYKIQDSSSDMSVFTATGASGSNPNANIFSLSSWQEFSDDETNSSNVYQSGSEGTIIYDSSSPYRIARYDLTVKEDLDSESPWYGAAPPDPNVNNQETFLWGVLIEVV